MSKIDLIIPTYKARETIFQALSSIAIQSVAKDINVIMVVDHDGLSYDDLYHKFDGVFGNFTVYYLAENGGPAVARQYGIDKSNSPYVMFLDADDTFSGAFAVELLANNLDKEPNVVLVSSVFFEKRKGLEFVQHQNDMVWLHGKIYRRAFLDKYDIRFNETRANEDVGFNTKIKLLESETERIKFVDTLTYFWHWNDTGITRVNNLEYTYKHSFFGYVDNNIDAIQHALKFTKTDDDFLVGYAIDILAHCYIYILRIGFNAPELEGKAWEYTAKFWNEIIENVQTDVISKEHFDEIISRVIENQMIHFRGRYIEMSFPKFMEILFQYL